MAPPPSADAGSAAPPRRLNDLGLRAVSGLVMLTLALVAARVGGVLFLIFWLAAACAVFWEWLRLPGAGARASTLVVGFVALVVVGILARSSPSEAIVTLLTATALQAAFCERPLTLWVVSGQLYAGMLVVAVMALRFSFPFGWQALIWLFAVVWSTDVFAYFGGRLIGGPKLWPRISPSKTWSGTMTGVAAGAAIGTWAAALDLPTKPALIQIFVLSLATAILSQAGDAFESGLKRHFGAKDSSRLIPGHGGVMDRLDGFIAAAIFAFLVGSVRNLPSIAGGLFYWA